MCGGGVVCVRGGVGWGRVGCGVLGCVGVGGLFKNTRKTNTDIKKKRHTDVGDLSLTSPPIPPGKQARLASKQQRDQKAQPASKHQHDQQARPVSK